MLTFLFMKDRQCLQNYATRTGIFLLWCLKAMKIVNGCLMGWREETAGDWVSKQPVTWVDECDVYCLKSYMNKILNEGCVMYNKVFVARVSTSSSLCSHVTRGLLWTSCLTRVCLALPQTRGSWWGRSCHIKAFRSEYLRSYSRMRKENRVELLQSFGEYGVSVSMPRASRLKKK